MMENINIFIIAMLWSATGQRGGAMETRRSYEARPKAPYFELARPQQSRPSCVLGPDHTFSRYNSTKQLSSLRARMADEGLRGYIISAEDVHKSEITPQHMKRLQYISGLTGDTGTAVVLERHAAIWVEGRYLSQAEEEVDCNWHVINGGATDTPTVDEWIKSTITGPNPPIGVDSRIISFREYQRLENALKPLGVQLRATPRNLVDEVWSQTGKRPKEPNGTITTHSIEFAGESWQEKVRRLRNFLKKSGIDSMFISDLREVAWLYNLRGSDIPYSPLFEAFVYLHHDEQRLYVNGQKLQPQVRDYLIMEECNNWACVQWRDYNQVYSELHELSKRDTRLLVSSQCSYAICGSIDQSKLVVSDAPIRTMMTIKNNIEIKGMQNANLKDSVCIVKMLAHLERDVAAGKVWTERRAIEHLNDLRRHAELYQGESFPSVSASGKHSSISHYQPKKHHRVVHRRSVSRRTLPKHQHVINGTDEGPAVTSVKGGRENANRIAPDHLYLIDTGAHYLDGSTDISRTLHFEKPTDLQQEIFTRVLMGHIDLFMTVIPEGTRDNLIDVIARRHLWQMGLDYAHGTGHGLGCYLHVREYPPHVSPVSRGFPILPGNIFTNEPAYYEVDQFGIKIETPMLAVLVNASEKPLQPNRFIKFEPLAFVPFEMNLVKLELMSPAQIRWLNDYHTRCLDKLQSHLRDDNDVAQWLERKTAPIKVNNCGAGGKSKWNYRDKAASSGRLLAPMPIRLALLLQATVIALFI